MTFKVRKLPSEGCALQCHALRGKGLNKKDEEATYKLGIKRGLDPNRCFKLAKFEVEKDGIISLVCNKHAAKLSLEYTLWKTLLDDVQEAQNVHGS